jgi:hypothetical protein
MVGWGKRVAAPALLLAWLALKAVGGGGPVAPFEEAAAAVPKSRIDELVFARLEELELTPARPCSDGVFLRRVYLDTIGTLPTVAETKAFLADREPDRRAVLIETLLARDEFVDYGAMRWADVLRLKAEYPIKLWPKSAEAYHRWVATCLAANQPYDRMARALLLATGSSCYVPEANFYRALQDRQPEQIAKAVALTFMGARAEQWPTNRLADMAAFFAQVRYKGTSEWKEEIVYLDVTNAMPVEGRLPDGTRVALPAGRDARAVFADWLVASDNPWFARNMVNRIWYRLLGRGIVHEPDDFGPDNPAAIPALLTYLERELVTSGWDLKHIHRLILNSQTYQLSSLAAADDPQAAAHFASYPVQRLDAEVLIDAICQITGTAERYVSPVPEPFTYVPEEQHTVNLSDGNSTSAFLELFGRPPRETGLASERANRSTAGQRLHLLNSTHIHDKLAQGPALRQWARDARGPREAAQTAYLAILSRYPTEAELCVVADYPSASGVKGMDALTDLAWALINTEEFLCRH